MNAIKNVIDSGIVLCQVKRNLIITMYLIGLSALQAQSVKQDSLNTPSISFFRAEEDYAYLKHQNSDTVYVVKDKFDPIKFVPLNRKKNIWLSFGGQYRPRFEYFNHQFLKKSNKSDGYYSHRIALHASIKITKNFRVFSEFYNGFLSKEGNIFTQEDPLTLHQLFVESKVNINGSLFSLRLGRQEMSYGISRLVGMREGPNIRLSFDAARLRFKKNRTSIDAFYGKEVLPNVDVFNDTRNKAMGFWGLYSKFFIKNGNGFTDLYYLGLYREQNVYEIGTAEEIRHTIGFRMSGKNGRRFFYNTELMYQFGSFGHKRISSFAIELDYHYTFPEKKYDPVLGIKLDYIMGDKNANDGKLNTFNSLFTNPTYFGQSATIAPANLLDIHPSFKLSFTKQISIEMDWDFLWRASSNDGVYAPAGFLLFTGASNNGKFIGHNPGLNVYWALNRNLSFDGKFSYLIPGKFIKEQNGSELTYIAITASYKI
ncbi:alginate export family protein [uncultured Psychroserpens sp.]|uniref:alginate export family protein n=1 Tax=uncultured Psychroserpens sp. TaxID=255436 RepID=UPI00260EC31C|nr:alginate export family protein [uncultured Psychroserpens sp.]